MASMENWNESVWNETCESIRPGPIFTTLTSILFFISTLSLIIHIFFSFLLYRFQSFHSNVRFLLQNFSISACYVSLHSIGRCAYNFYIISNGFQSSTSLHCEWIQTAFNASEASLTLSMACIGLDRLISTIRHKNIDSTRPSIMAYCMVAICWSSGILFHIISLSITAEENMHRIVCYCQEILITPLAILYYMVTAFFLMEFFTALCYLILYSYSLRNFSNFTINTAKHSLSERHQMLSNIKTSILLCPSIILHGSVYAIISLSFLPLRLYLTRDNYAIRINLALLILIIMELEMMTQAILIICRKDTLRKSVVKYLPVLVSRLIRRDSEDVKPAQIIRQPTGEGTRVNVINVATPKVIRNMAGTGKLVEFRMKPEHNDDILNAMWATVGTSKQKAGKK